MMAEPLPAASPGPDLCLLIIFSMLSEFEYHPFPSGISLLLPLYVSDQGGIVALHPGTCIWVGRPNGAQYLSALVLVFGWGDLPGAFPCVFSV